MQHVVQNKDSNPVVRGTALHGQMHAADARDEERVGVGVGVGGGGV